MEWQVYDHRFPWILWSYHPNGGFQALDQRDGFLVNSATWDGVIQFAADRSVQKGKTGIGNLIKGVTSLFGVKRCTPCAKRQAELNQWGQIPQEWDPFS